MSDTANAPPPDDEDAPPPAPAPERPFILTDPTEVFASSVPPEVARVYFAPSPAVKAG